jgi:hypothetical protein
MESEIKFKQSNINGPLRAKGLHGKHADHNPKSIDMFAVIMEVKQVGL